MPHLGDESQRQCETTYPPGSKPNSDRTCCVHAEWNAILNALQTHPNELEGSTLYFMRTDANGAYTQAGKPYCTVCSRLALQAGITTFALWNDGPDLYNTHEYNQVSYDYHK